MCEHSNADQDAKSSKPETRGWFLTWLVTAVRGLFVYTLMLIMLWAMAFAAVWLLGLVGVDMAFRFGETASVAFVIMSSAGAFIGIIAGSTDGILKKIRLSTGARVLLGAISGAIHGTILGFLFAALPAVETETPQALIVTIAIVGAVFGAMAHNMMGQLDSK